jgi:Protein of unknown function (DUF1674)
VNRKIPKCAKRAQLDTAMLAMSCEMGATAAMSTPATNSPFDLIQSRSAVMRPHFLANFTVMPTCEDQISIHRQTPPAEGTPVPDAQGEAAAAAPPEIGGREGPEPTRFGDWELRGRCIDF